MNLGGHDPVYDVVIALLPGWLGWVLIKVWKFVRAGGLRHPGHYARQEAQDDLEAAEHISSTADRLTLSAVLAVGLYLMAVSCLAGVFAAAIMAVTIWPSLKTLAGFGIGALLSAVCIFTSLLARWLWLICNLSADREKTLHELRERVAKHRPKPAA